MPLVIESAVGAVVLLAFVTAQRLLELVLAARNTKALRAAGAVEHAPGHYPLIVAVHTGWLLALWLLAVGETLHLGWLGLFILLQLGRVWVLMTLGPRWTTRIITVPGEVLVKKGPYRWIRHPNYVVVAGEIFVLPMVFGFWQLAVVFSLLNAAVLAIRIRAENAALALPNSEKL